MFDALPPEPPPYIVARSTRDQTPQIVMGFFAFGAEADVLRLDAAARALDLPASRVDTLGEVIEWGVLFPVGGDRAAALSILRDARAGRFGPLRIDVVIVPVADAADGIDFETEAQAVPPDRISEPE